MLKDPIARCEEPQDTSLYTIVEPTSQASYSSRYSGEARSIIGIMQQSYDQKRPFISRSHWLTTSSGAKLGYLMNRLVCKRSGTEAQTNTIFTNSELEALSGAIRLSRQKAYQSGQAGSPKVLILDRNSYYADFFNPCRAKADEALCPEVEFIREENTFIDRLRSERYAAAVVVQTAEPFANATLSAVQNLCRARGAVSIVVDADRPLTSDGAASPMPLPDILIFGDNLADRKMPCGCSIMQPEVYSVWNNRVAAAIFMSTWAGNCLALEAAIATLRKRGHISPEDDLVLTEIENDYDERVRYFKKYVHPPFYDSIAMSGFAFDVVAAEGVEIELRDGRRLLDVGGGLGCSLRGQNPAGFKESVLATYDPSVRYNVRLERLVREHTKFAHVLPGVSGASAVDNAISAALMANPTRRRIIGFKGNYSGKTLVSVNMSVTSHIIVEPFPEALAPYYPDVVYVDPFAPGAAEELRTLLIAGDVALVWFEITQGYMCEPLPDDILQVIAENKQDGGYLVGVDEVLTGMFRDGRNLLHHTSRIDCVDVVSMSKATSDMSFPVSWALITDEIFKRAGDVNPGHIARLKEHYASPLGLHVGVKAVEAALEFSANNDIVKELEFLREELEEVARASDLFDGVSASGNLVRLNLNQEWFPFPQKSLETTIIETVLTRHLISECGILFNNLRIFLPNLADRETNRKFITRLRSTYNSVTPEGLYKAIMNLLGDMAKTTAIPEFLRSRGLIA